MPALNSLSLHWPACLHCVSSVWASPHHPIRAVQLWPIREALFQLINRVSLDQSNCQDLESSFVQGRTNQRPGEGTLVSVSQFPAAQQCTFPFHWRLDTSEASLRASTLGRADRCSAKQVSKEKQSRPVYMERSLVPELFDCHTFFIVVLYQNWAVLHWIKFSSSLHSKLGIPVGVELVATTICWHLWEKIHVTLLLLWINQ